MTNPEIMKTNPRIITKVVLIPLFRASFFPMKPVVARMKARLTMRTANQGTIVPMYFIAPPAETNIVATRNEKNKLNHLLLSRSFVFASIAKTTKKTIRKAAMGAKYAIAVGSAGIFLLCWS